MGGYDIFSAKGSGSTWSTPVNLKFPLNSTSDDFCYVSNDGKTGYFWHQTDKAARVTMIFIVLLIPATDDKSH
jgi:hypothetical protein